MGVYEGLKDAAAVLKEAQKIEEYRQILDAQKEMLDMQKKIVELEGENRDLKQKLKNQSELVYKNNSYWNQNGDGPFCSNCQDGEQKLIRTHPCGNPAYHECPKCKTTVQVGHDKNDDYQQPPYESSSFIV